MWLILFLSCGIRSNKLIHVHERKSLKSINLWNCHGKLRASRFDHFTASSYKTFFYAIIVLWLNTVSLLTTCSLIPGSPSSLQSCNSTTHRVNLPRSIRIHTRPVRSCLALQARKSRVKGWFRVACASQGKQWANPGQGAPRKHAPTDKVMSIFAERFLEAIASQ